MAPAEADPAVTFDGEVLDAGRGGHAVIVPKEVAAQFPGRRVDAEVNGAPYASKLATYSGRTYLGLRQALLRSIGAVTGDTVHVVLRATGPEPETEPVAEAVAAAELDEALAADPAFQLAFDALPEPHRVEYRRWIAGGEPPDRQIRVQRLRHRLVT